MTAQQAKEHIADLKEAMDASQDPGEREVYAGLHEQLMGQLQELLDVEVRCCVYLFTYEAPTYVSVRQNLTFTSPWVTWMSRMCPRNKRRHPQRREKCPRVLLLKLLNKYV
jgi:hypothetical protein